MTDRERAIEAAEIQFDFDEMLRRLRCAGWADGDIAWAEHISPPTDAEDFALEVIYVICNSGMKFTVARNIYDKVRAALEDGVPVSTCFGHAGKVGAIETVWRDRTSLFAEYGAAVDKLAFLVELPWIGDITKYHLAKNFGLQVVKPDVHLQRLADLHGTTPQVLCEALAAKTGYRVATIDTLLWRACAVGIMKSRTAMLQARPDKP